LIATVIIDVELWLIEQPWPENLTSRTTHRKLDHATQRLNVAKFDRFVHGAFVV